MFLVEQLCGHMWQKFTGLVAMNCDGDHDAITALF
jgi:hypothetical protein